MDKIILEVNEVIAENWDRLSQEKQTELSAIFSRLVKTAFDRDRKEFSDFLDRIGREAAANGLTEEILNKILNEED